MLRCDGCREAFFIGHHPAWQISELQNGKQSGSRKSLLKSMSATRDTPTE
jgi:hypothetical protein